MLPLGLLACTGPTSVEVPREPTTPPEDTGSAPLLEWTGDAVVTTAADLDALAGIGRITGDLVVDGTSLAALDLPALVEVGGDVRIWRDEQLATLALPALVTVGGDLSLYDLPELRSLGGLSALASVGGTLSINRDPALVDLRGLEALEEIGVDLYVFHAVGLRSVDGLDRLARVGGSVDLWEAYALTDATFPALASATRVDVFECDALTTLSFPALSSLRSFELHECDAMTDLGAFPGVTAMEGELRIEWNDGLRSLAGFDGLAEVGSLLVDHAPELGSIDLPALGRAESVEVSWNDGLADPGLEALATVTTAAVFVNNPLLSQCAVEALLDRVDPPEAVCAGNLDDGCLSRCAP